MDIVAAKRQRTDETLYTMQLNEYQVQQLASGFVPATVKATMDFLTWQEQDEARAKRPEPKKRKAPRAAAGGPQGWANDET